MDTREVHEVLDVPTNWHQLLAPGVLLAIDEKDSVKQAEARARMRGGDGKAPGSKA